MSRATPSEPPPIPHLYTLAEVGEQIGVSAVKVLKLIEKHRIVYTDLSGLAPGEHGRRQARLNAAQVSALLVKLNRIPPGPAAEAERTPRETAKPRRVKPRFIAAK